MGLAPRLEVQQIFEVLAVTAMTSLSDLEESMPPLKKVRTKGCVPLSAWYIYVGCCMPFFVAYQFLYLSLVFDGL
jgi:hypothetical protein